MGASAAEGIRNQLGRPELDLMTILVRESAQNSWDAHLEDTGLPVDYRLDLWTVSPAHVGAWRDLLLNDAPAAAYLPLRDSLRRGAVQVLAVSDRGTTGLGGPTRADRASDSDRDFVSFIRNIGEPRDTALGGGTYGFGKGIFYLISKPGVIIVHTRCRSADGSYETRLMGCAMWKSYVVDEDGGKRRYTGRHWWGDTSGDVIEPLTGPEAEGVARRLGLKPFGAAETGTTIVVVDPLLQRDDETLKPVEAADYLADTLAWHLWPKMIETGGGGPAMRFSVSCDGVEHPVPDPRTTPGLKMFVAAYEDMVGPNGLALDCHRPKRHLGRLGLVKRIMPPLVPTLAARMVGVDRLLHHVCLMRPAELVVTYWQGVRPPSENLGYAGTFRADTAMDDVYAQAEPPTHDAWHHQPLEHPDSTFVRTTFTRLAESVDGLLNLGGGVRDGAAKVALGAASSMFSGLVGGAWGIGGATAYAKPGSTTQAVSRRRAKAGDAAAEEEYVPHGAASAGAGVPGVPGDWPEPDEVSATGRRGTPRPRVQYVGEPYYDERKGATVLVQEFRLPVALSQRVRIELAVTLPGAGGRETEPPQGARMPELAGWEDSQGVVSDTPTCVMQGGDGRIWRALVLPAPDTMTEIGVKVEAVQAS
ncbi:hypothetical protein [Streptacidiphilus anmyonensis]|uniref:hypothetical protein n=1 Tax=Streptacidiphilus anmyonensis TaxID=405782 RepID=UPI00128BCC39|nr:hypothetical protein [Streptacidiphilus anmyonensis]